MAESYEHLCTYMYIIWNTKITVYSHIEYDTSCRRPCSSFCHPPPLCYRPLSCELFTSTRCSLGLAAHRDSRTRRFVSLLSGLFAVIVVNFKTLSLSCRSLRALLPKHLLTSINYKKKTLYSLAFLPQ